MSKATKGRPRKNDDQKMKSIYLGVSQGYHSKIERLEKQTGKPRSEFLRSAIYDYLDTFEPRKRK